MIVRPNRPLLSQPRPSRQRLRAALTAASVASALFGMTLGLSIYSTDTHAQASAASAASSMRYTVKPNQSLTDIAGQVTGSTDRTVRENMARQIFDANPNAFSRHDPSKLRLGSVLNVPASASASNAGAAASTSASSAPASASASAVAPAVAASAAASSPVASSPGAVVPAAPVAPVSPTVSNAPAAAASASTPAGASGAVAGALATGAIAGSPVASSAATPASDSVPSVAAASDVAASISAPATASASAPVSAPVAAPVVASVAPASTAAEPPAASIAAETPDVWSERAPLILLFAVLVLVGLLIYALVAAQRRRRERLEAELAVSDIDDGDRAAWQAVSAGGSFVPRAPSVTVVNPAHGHSHDVAPSGAADLDGVALQRGQSELNGVAAGIENYDAAQVFETPTDDVAAAVPHPSPTSRLITSSEPVEDVMPTFAAHREALAALEAGGSMAAMPFVSTENSPAPSAEAPDEVTPPIVESHEASMDHDSTHRSENDSTADATLTPADPISHASPVDEAPVAYHENDFSHVKSSDPEPVAQHGQSDLSAVAAGFENNDAARISETPIDDNAANAAVPFPEGHVSTAALALLDPVDESGDARDAGKASQTTPSSDNVQPPPEPAPRRAPFIPDAPASLHRAFIPRRPAEIAAERAAQEAREQAEREAREAEARAVAEREAREEAARLAAQREAEAREQAEREAREEEARRLAQREAEAREQAEREAREEEARVVAQREAEAREQAEREAREEEARRLAQREAEARAQAEREAREEEARVVAQREAEAREQAEREAREEEARRLAQREAEAREQADREAREEEASRLAQREAEAREQAEREAREEEARRLAQREAEAREQAEREAREEEARRLAQREAEAREQAERESREEEARQTAQREAQEAEAQWLAQRNDNISSTSHSFESNQSDTYGAAPVHSNDHPQQFEPQSFQPRDNQTDFNHQLRPDNGYARNDNWQDNGYSNESNPSNPNHGFHQPAYDQPASNEPGHIDEPYRQNVDQAAFAPTTPHEFDADRPFVANPAADFPQHDALHSEHYTTPHEPSPYDDDEPTRVTPFPPPSFPQEAIESLATREFDLPPRQDAGFQPEPKFEPNPPASVEGMGASRFGPLSLDFDYNQPASHTDPLPAFTPAQIATIAHNKLDLASEYIALGDLSGARTLLQEVIESNDPATRQRAATLLSTLAPLS